MTFPVESRQEHVTTVRVRYAETDRMGVVYYANYFVWFEVGRAEWFRACGRTYQELERLGTVLPVLEAHCEYEHSARYDDEVEIAVTCQLLSPVRVRFEYRLTRRSDGRTLASGWSVHAAVDTAGRLKRLPDEVRSLFA
jgi:acyl-CoA thioester hydrolase